MSSFVKWSPRFLVYAVFRGLAYLYFQLNTDEKKSIREAIVDCLGAASSRIGGIRLERTIRETYRHVADHYVEKMLVSAKPLSETMKVIKSSRLRGLRILKSAFRTHRGVIVATTHWGAAELTPALLCMHGFPLSIILETATPALLESLRRLTAGMDVELIVESGGSKVLASALGALSRGRVLITQVDEVDAWRRRPGKTIRLFGKTLYFDHTVEFIARKSGAAVVGLFANRIGMDKYAFTVERVSKAGEAGGSAEKSLRLWERYVLKSPEQWYQWKKWSRMLAVGLTIN